MPTEFDNRGGDPDKALILEMWEREVLAEHIRKSQEIIGRSQRLLKRIDGILGRGPHE